MGWNTSLQIQTLSKARRSRQARHHKHIVHTAVHHQINQQVKGEKDLLAGAGYCRPEDSHFSVSLS